MTFCVVTMPCKTTSADEFGPKTDNKLRKTAKRVIKDLRTVQKGRTL
jgi:hypothetical protein